MERIFSLIAKFFESIIVSCFLNREEEELYLASKADKDKVEEKNTVAAKEDIKQEEKVAHQKRYLWLLDNGHGETTPGKRSPIFDDGRQLFEYEFNRAVVARIKKRLDEIGVAYVDLVPTDDDVSLGDRVALAAACDDQGLDNKVYVSVHGNAATDDWSSANGIETFCYPGSTTGHRLGDVFQKHLIDQTGWRDRGVKEAKFYVLRKTTMPAILTENGFFSNQQQCEQMLSAEYRDKIAEAHVQAILEIEKDGI